MEFNFNPYALSFFFFTFLIILWHHRSIGELVPPQISLIKYIDQKYQWNAWGHWLTQFSIAMALGVQTNLPWFYYIIPSVIIASLIEFIVQKNKLTRDTWFDLFTHFSGGFTAALLFI